MSLKWDFNANGTYFFCILVLLDYKINLKWRFSVSPLRSSRKPPVFLTKEKKNLWTTKGYQLVNKIEITKTLFLSTMCCKVSKKTLSNDVILTKIEGRECHSEGVRVIISGGWVYLFIFFSNTPRWWEGTSEDAD